MYYYCYVILRTSVYIKKKVKRLGFVKGWPSARIENRGSREGQSAAKKLPRATTVRPTQAFSLAHLNITAHMRWVFVRALVVHFQTCRIHQSISLNITNLQLNAGVKWRISGELAGSMYKMEETKECAV